MVVRLWGLADWLGSGEKNEWRTLAQSLWGMEPFRDTESSEAGRLDTPRWHGQGVRVRGVSVGVLAWGRHPEQSLCVRCPRRPSP